MKSRLSIENIKKAFDNIDPVFLNTPQFICDSLSEILNCKVILKVETLNPIRCFKGRSAFNYVSNLKEGSTLVCASAGNLGQAVAYACSKKNIKPIIFNQILHPVMLITKTLLLLIKIILQIKIYKRELMKFFLLCL